MKDYLKLVHMEIHRFRYILAGLMGITIIIQFGTLILAVMSDLSRRKSEGLINGSITGGFLPIDKLSFAEAAFYNQFWFSFPILLCIAVLAFYIFFIWYRDWIGRYTFVYRLLMLPIARKYLYLAKYTATLMFVFGLVSFQLLLLLIEQQAFNLIVPEEWREPSYLEEVISANQVLDVLIPRNFDQFMISYGFGIVAMLAVFTSVLLERSFRRLGIAYAVLYLFICSMAVIFPLTFGIGIGSYLYMSEVIVLEIAVCVIIAAASVWIGFRLLSKKITV